VLRKEKLQTEFDSIQVVYNDFGKIAQIDKIRNEDLNVATLQNTIANLLGFRCES